MPFLNVKANIRISIAVMPSALRNFASCTRFSSIRDSAPCITIRSRWSARDHEIGDSKPFRSLGSGKTSFVSLLRKSLVQFEHDITRLPRIPTRRMRVATSIDTNTSTFCRRATNNHQRRTRDCSNSWRCQYDQLRWPLNSQSSSSIVMRTARVCDANTAVLGHAVLPAGQANSSPTSSTPGAVCAAKSTASRAHVLSSGYQDVVASCGAQPNKPRSANRIISGALDVLQSAIKAWNMIQVSHCGRYSIERTIAFEEYCRSTSKERLTVVLLLTPIPAVLIVMAMELLPLRPPKDGCFANYVFWVRHWFAVGVLALAGMLRGKFWIQELSISRVRMAVVSFISSGIYVGLNVVAAYVWVFPIPFLAVLGGIIMFPIWLAAIVLTVGYRTVIDTPGIRELLLRFFDEQGAEAMLMLLYPAYHAGFLAVQPSVQSAYMVVLPLINLVMKNVIVSKAFHLEDGVPEIVVFSVDVFSALYSVFCMRSASTLSSVASIAVADTFVIALTVYGMHKRTILTRNVSMTTTSIAVYPIDASQSSMNAAVATEFAALAVPSELPMVIAALEHPDHLVSSEIKDVRLLSATPHTLSPAGTARLSAMDNIGIYNSMRMQIQRSSLWETKQRYSAESSNKTRLLRKILDSSSSLVSGLSTGAIHDRSAADSPSLKAVQSTDRCPTQKERRRSTSKEVLMLIRKRNTAVVLEVLQLLFSSEYLVLIAYVQCIIPPMFAIFMSVLYNLPNLDFYPHAVELSNLEQLQKRLATIALYWGLKVVQLLAVNWLLSRKFTVPALYQIAFVLESHALLVQCSLTFTLIFSVQSTLHHYGADYSFQFEWMHHNLTESAGGGE